MFRFNTIFLLKATALTALGCLPMALNTESGFVWTAFFLPISLAWLASTQVRTQGEFAFKFKEFSDPVVEIYGEGGPQIQWVTRGRIIAAGFCLSVALGFPMLHLVDPEPIELWLPIVALFAVGALMLIGYSARRSVLTQERQFVTDYLLFGHLRWWRRRWQIREGDYLAAFSGGQPMRGALGDQPAEFLFWHSLFVCRSRRRQMIAFMYSSEPVVPDLNVAADRVARLVDLPYEGYRELKGYWWPR